MIRINLLTDREAVRRESGRQVISIFVLSLCLLLVILGGTHFRLHLKKKGLEEDVRRVNVALNELQAKVAEVERYKAVKLELETQLGIIETLETGRSWVPLMLDNLGESLPDRMWVEKLSMRGSQLGLEGYAIDHETVAAFMKTLERSSFFESVELQVTERKPVGGVSMQSFSIVSRLNPKASEAVAEGAGPARRHPTGGRALSP